MTLETQEIVIRLAALFGGVLIGLALATVPERRREKEREQRHRAEIARLRSEHAQERIKALTAQVEGLARMKALVERLSS